MLTPSNEFTSREKSSNTDLDLIQNPEDALDPSFSPYYLNIDSSTLQQRSKKPRIREEVQDLLNQILNESEEIQQSDLGKRKKKRIEAEEEEKSNEDPLGAYLSQRFGESEKIEEEISQEEDFQRPELSFLSNEEIETEGKRRDGLKERTASGDFPLNPYEYRLPKKRGNKLRLVFFN